MDEHVQSANVALDWDFLQENIAANGLNLHASYWGTWSGRDDAHDFQDVLVLQKNP
jgi:hypothetical protein